MPSTASARTARATSSGVSARETAEVTACNRLARSWARFSAVMSNTSATTPSTSPRAVRWGMYEARMWRVRLRW